MKTEVTYNKESTVTLIGEIPFEKLEAHREEAVKHLGEHVELPGFRKGHIPPKILKDHIGEAALLAEMAERALTEELPSIFAEHTVLPLGRPSVSITKLASGNPLGFRIETPVLPKVVLPDVKAIAKNIPIEKPSDITSKEIDDVVHEIRHRIYHAERDARGETHSTSSGQAHEHAPDEVLPELTDELVKKLGDYENLENFKEKLTAELKMRKMYEVRDRRRSEILDAILKETPLELPNILVEAELDKMLQQFKSDVERVGMKFSDYLTQVRKTEEELRASWRTDAEKRAKSQLLLNEIARHENIHVDQKNIDAKVNEIIGENQNAPQETVAIYVETILTNEKVFETLETL